MTSSLYLYVSFRSILRDSDELLRVRALRGGIRVSYRERYLAMSLQSRFPGSPLQPVTLRLAAVPRERDLRQPRRGERDAEELQVGNPRNFTPRNVRSRCTIGPGANVPTDTRGRTARPRLIAVRARLV